MKIMNARQQRILFRGILIAFLLLLFPPLVLHYPNGTQRNAGYGFLLAENNGAVVNFLLLFSEWLILTIICWGLIYFDRNWDTHSIANNINRREIQVAIIEGWNRSKLFRLTCLGAFMFDSVIAIGSNGKDHLIFSNSLTRAIGWVILLVINFIYHAVRAYRGSSEKKVNNIFSIKRVTIACILIIMALNSLEKLNRTLNLPDSKIPDTQSSIKPWERDWSQPTVK